MITALLARHLIFAVFGFVCVSSVAVFCPKECTCFQRTVRCIRSRLTEIPLVPRDTNILDLRYNRLEEITENAFDELDKVTTLFLSENNIGFIHENAFSGLVALKYLYLNNNRISTIPSKAFRGLPYLESLYLENNDIWQINATTFQHSTKLNRLFLFNNKITSIPVGAFSNLPSLKRIRLDGNPIDCNCGVYSLWRQFIPNLQLNQVAISLICESPAEIYGTTFTELQENQFHCKKPEVLKPPQDVEIKTGEYLELPCQMIGDPEPEIIWIRNTNEISLEDSPRIKILPPGNLIIDSVQADDVGIYECIGRNDVGETKSPPIRVVLVSATASTLQPEHLPYFTRKPSDVVVAPYKGKVVLDCTAAGYPQPEIQWYFNGRLVTQSTQTTLIQSNGSLIIKQLNFPATGTYKCEASNHLGNIQSTVKLQVKEIPDILLAPQNQSVKIGKQIILECDADGNPLPEIAWKFNGVPITSNSRIVLENENTELIVSEAKESDSGVYTCTAMNENGISEASATISVEGDRGVPRLLFEPFDLEALAGTTIELPCKAADEDIQIKWRKDGRLIDGNDKYIISPGGSLYVKNVTLFDAGRYECSIKNNYGRVTASGLIRIRSNDVLAPGDRYVRVAFAEAAKEIDLAINNTIDTLFSNRSRINTSVSHPNYSDLLRVFRFPTGEGRQLARAAEIYERTMVNIRKHVQKGENLSIESRQYEFNDLLSREHLHLVAELSGCMEHREMPNCTDMCFHSKYRSIDGTCNNLIHPTWGASLTAFRRIEKPIYENGFSMPIGWTKDKLYNGYPKPSARLISTSLITTEEITPDDSISHMVMQWGQFLDHDLDHAIPSVSSESWDGIDCKKTCNFAPPCYPIVVPPNDPRVNNRRCIDVVRSSSICGSGMTSVFFDSIQMREQINQLTSFIDASQVYGYSFEFSQDLRNLTSDEGLLRTGVHFPNQRAMLPFAAPQDGMDCRRNLEENNLNCFVAGDIRVNEQVGLLAMHTIWMREHNRIAIKLHEINPHWDGDTLYQESRKIVGAQMQHITYKHWLPLVIGPSGMTKLGEYSSYDPNVNPSIANEFATAALRFGHTIINPILHRLNSSFQPIPQGHLQLHKAFFAPWRLAYEGGVDPLMRGLFSIPAKLKKSNQNLNADLTERLFHTSHAVALDLAAINIQRGRDHGIPGYNEYRQFCNLTKATKFDDLKEDISDSEVRLKLKKLYGHPDNIDIWVGGILEDQVDGGKVGPLFQCLLVEQFRRLRDGDRFYYENPSVFIPEQLLQIKQANLGRVLCDSGDDIKEVTDNVFMLPNKQGGYKTCKDVLGINLYFWQDCGLCNSLPPLLKHYAPQTYTKRSRNKRSLTDLPMRDTHSLDNELATRLELNEERVSGQEEVISSFQKELKKLHKQIHKLEQSCGVGHQTTNSSALEIGKQQGHHCVDQLGNTRLPNEVWNLDRCTNCECRLAQVTCIRKNCGEVSCKAGINATTVSEECCTRSPDKAIQAERGP